mgnify:CR=1 FL=1
MVRSPFRMYLFVFGRAVPSALERSNASMRPQVKKTFGTRDRVRPGAKKPTRKRGRRPPQPPRAKIPRNGDKPYRTKDKQSYFNGPHQHGCNTSQYQTCVL